MRVIRQKVPICEVSALCGEVWTEDAAPLTAPGIVARGSGVSVAARPTSSVPANEKAAVTNWCTGQEGQQQPGVYKSGEGN